MTDKDKVCGYANKETLSVHMDIHNNNGLEYQQKWIKTALGVAVQHPNDAEAIVKLAAFLQSHYERKNNTTYHTGQFSVIHQLATDALARVDWLELGKELLVCAYEQIGTTLTKEPQA